MSEPSSRRAIRGWYASEPYHSLIFWRFGNQHRPGAFFTDQQLDHPLAVRCEPRPETISPNCFSSCITARSRGAQNCSAFADDTDRNKADAAMRLKMILISLVLSLGSTRWTTQFPHVGKRCADRDPAPKRVYLSKFMRAFAPAQTMLFHLFYEIIS